MNTPKVELVNDQVKGRRYISTAREKQAAHTRRAILRAAEHLFGGRGYQRTAVADIAKRARVSLDTVYASVGRKPQLLLAVVDMMLGESEEVIPAEEREYVRAIRAAATAEAKIATYADALGTLLPRIAPLLSALQDAAPTDPGCARVWTQINDRRAANMALFTDDLRGTGRVREDLSDQDVADIVWSTNSVQYFSLLASRGWSGERYAVLLREMWTRLLLS